MSHAILAGHCKKEPTKVVHFSPGTDLRYNTVHSKHSKEEPIKASHAGHCEERVRNPMRSSSGATHSKQEPTKTAEAGHHTEQVGNTKRSSSYLTTELHCSFFHRENGCTDGDKCKYKHVSKCTYFKTASGCKHGITCHYSHKF